MEKTYIRTGFGGMPTILTDKPRIFVLKDSGRTGWHELKRVTPKGLTPVAVLDEDTLHELDVCHRLASE